MKSVPHGTDEIFLTSDEIHSVDEILPSARLRISFNYSFVSRRVRLCGFIAFPCGGRGTACGGWGCLSLLTPHPSCFASHLPPLGKALFNAQSYKHNPSVTCGDSSLYTREPLFNVQPHVQCRKASLSFLRSFFTKKRAFCVTFSRKSKIPHCKSTTQTGGETPPLRLTGNYSSHKWTTFTRTSHHTLHEKAGDLYRLILYNRKQKYCFSEQL